MALINRLSAVLFVSILVASCFSGVAAEASPKDASIASAGTPPKSERIMPAIEEILGEFDDFDHEHEDDYLHTADRYETGAEDLDGDLHTSERMADGHHDDEHHYYDDEDEHYLEDDEDYKAEM